MGNFKFVRQILIKIQFKWNVSRLIKDFQFRINDKKTRPEFTHQYKDLHCIVADPDDFYEQAAIMGVSPFSMQCLQCYIQMRDGTWVKHSIIARELYTELLEAGVTEIERNE